MEHYLIITNEDILSFAGKTRNYHPEWDDSDSKRHAWYVLPNKWILAKIICLEYPRYSPQNSKRSTSWRAQWGCLSPTWERRKQLQSRWEGRT
jgi:hypothetical protein